MKRLVSCHPFLEEKWNPQELLPVLIRSSGRIIPEHRRSKQNKRLVTLWYETQKDRPALLKEMHSQWTERQPIFHYFLVSVCQIAEILGNSALIADVCSQADDEMVRYKTLVGVIKIAPAPEALERQPPKATDETLETCRMSKAEVEYTVNVLKTTAAHDRVSSSFWETNVPEKLHAHLTDLPDLWEDDSSDDNGDTSSLNDDADTPSEASSLVFR